MNTLMRWLGIVRSVMAGFFGVQSQRQYVKDASTFSIIPFIIVGVIMVFIFILSIWFGVNLLLPSA